MDKILQQIGTFLGRKFSKIYTIFNDKYNELDNKKVDKEEGKELMPSPEGASDTVFLSETGWREVNTDKIRTHVISISIPFDSAWDFNSSQEITLEEGDYNRDEADSFIYDYFRYNNPNVVIRNTNTTTQSSQKGYHTVWKVALDTIAEERALRLYLDIPKNLSFTMAPEADSAKFTRYCILLYLSQDEENQTYTLNNIGILPNGTDSFIPRKYLDGKLSDITSSYLPLSGGLMTGNIAFPDGKGLGSAVGQSDLLVRSGNTVKLGSAGFSARLYAENPVVREGREGMFTMYDTSNLDIDKPFVTDLWTVYDAEGKNTQSIAVDLYNPVAKSATKVYRELLPVTDTNMGLMTPSYKTALDKLISSSGESLSIYGTPASTWQLTLGTGPKLKNSGGIFELRDNSDSAYTDLVLNNLTIKGNITQEGSSFITEAETVEVSDNILLLNRGEVGSGVTKGISGIQVDRGALTDYQFIFDESDDRFKVGVEGDLWPVMLRNNESDLSDKFFLSWDASLKRAVTTNIVPETGLLFSGGVSNHPEYDITIAATGSGSIGFGALQANTPWTCSIGYNLNTRDAASTDILDFATSLNAYRYDKPSILNMIYFDTYLSPNSISSYGASSISLTTGSGDDLIHTKGGQNYIIYDSGNLNIEELATKDDISGLGTVYYPYSGRGHMTIGADGRPILANNQGILFNTTSGAVEGIYVTTNNHLNIGGSLSNNIPVDIYNDLNIARIVDRSTNYSLLVFSNGGTEDSQYTHIGAEYGTTRIRSGLFNLVHDRGGTLYTVFDAYNFSSNLGTTNLNSSFNHLPMMAAQTANSDATTDRGYPIQEAGSLIVIPGVYNGSSQIYGSYDTNRWFVRGGGVSNDVNGHTAWKELATTTHLSEYLPLSGGTLTRTTSGPVLSLKNTSTNKEAYMDFYKGDVRCGYIGAAASNSEDMYLNAYESRNMIVGTPQGITRLESGNNNLIHRKNGTDYTILDTANIASLTIQFNGSTNTTYAPNEAKTVNITPAAIGAAASSHTHNYAASPSAGGPATYILDSGGGDNIQLAYEGTGLTASTATHFVAIGGTLVNGCRVFRNMQPGEAIKLMGAAEASHTHTTIKGTYTDNGGAQPPSYVTAGTLRANMMYHNMSGTPYCDYIMMDTYTRSGTPYVTMIGVTKTATPRAFIASGPRGDTNTSSWVIKELATKDAIPTTMAWSSITGTPSFATVATSGSYSDLINKPSIPSYSIATDSTAGLVKPISVITKPSLNSVTTTSGRYYSVQMSSDGNMFVNVPWSSGVSYTLPTATSTVLGGVKIGSGITVNSGTISVTKSNITSALGYTPPTTNTTYSVMTGATSSAAGTSGLVPAPAAGKQSSFLRGDGTWVVPTDTNTHYTTRIYAGESGTAANSAVSSPFIKITDDNTYRNQIRLLAGTNITINSDTTGVITISAAAYPAVPSTLPNPNSLSLTVGSTSKGSYNGSSAVSWTISAADIMNTINSQSEITFSKHVVCSDGAGTSSTSDIRFKNNITPLAPVLSHVLESPGFFYTWKDEDEVLVGTSAQYWEGKVTGLVREINDENKTKTFSYERYTVILQEALKEEHMLREKEKEEYKKEISSLREELEDLKKLVQKLV